MSDKIEVGDRVHDFCYGNGTALALHLAADGECWVWSEYDKPKTCYGTRITDLTRIEPEKVALTVGQKVRLSVGSSEGRVGIIKDLREEAYVEIDDSRETTVHWPPLRIWKLSSELEPVPSPCPECKGSGVASE
jgi:hypothetical protein